MLPSPKKIRDMTDSEFGTLKEFVKTYAFQPNNKSSLQAIRKRILDLYPPEIFQSISKHLDLPSMQSLGQVFPQSISERIRERGRRSKQQDMDNHEEWIKTLVRENRVSLLDRIYRTQDYFFVLDTLIENDGPWDVLVWMLQKEAPKPVIQYLVLLGLENPESHLMDIIFTNYAEWIEGNDQFWRQVMEYSINHNIDQGVALALDHGVELPPHAVQYAGMLQDPF